MKSSSSVELVGGVYDQLPMFHDHRHHHHHHHHQINGNNNDNIMMWENTLIKSGGDLINIPPTSFIHHQQHLLQEHHRQNKPADHHHQYAATTITTTTTTPSEDALENLEIQDEPIPSFNRVQRRQAQNREAARKCRMKKKAYVQQLETCRLKLTQMEQEIEKARQQGSYVGGANTSGLSSLSINPGIATFEMEYKQWADEQKRQYQELRNLLQVQVSETELDLFVKSAFNHYYKLFRMNVDVANTDVFFLITGVWRTPIERTFLWIGGDFVHPSS